MIFRMLARAGGRNEYSLMTGRLSVRGQMHNKGGGESSRPRRGGVGV